MSSEHFLSPSLSLSPSFPLSYSPLVLSKIKRASDQANERTFVSRTKRCLRERLHVAPLFSGVSDVSKNRLASPYRACNLLDFLRSGAAQMSDGICYAETRVRNSENGTHYLYRYRIRRLTKVLERLQKFFTNILCVSQETL